MAVRALAMATAMFIRYPTSWKNDMNMLDRRMRRTKSGFPGGCGTPSVCPAAVYSPQSQNATVGATVAV